MDNSKGKFKLTKIAFVLQATLFTGILYAETPTNLSRLSFINGTVTLSPAGSKDWANATLNRPLVNGDRIWDDEGAKSEIQFNDSAIRMGAKTSVNALNLANKTAQIQLSQGSVCMRVRTLGSDQIYEVDTPNLAFSVLQPGDYRIDVSADGKSTTVTVKTGGSQVSSEGTSYKVDANKSYNFTGTKLEHTAVNAVSSDDFDNWCSERNAQLGPINATQNAATQEDTSTSKQKVSDKIPGGTELNNSGTWSQNKKYGKSWTPSGVPSNWKPYTDGRWVWINSIGWTWVDNAPWGYAPFHYGNWVLVDGVWSWIPGDTFMEPVFAPALVGFVDGLGGPYDPLLGWFPLLPGELYVPPYQNLPDTPGTYVNIVEPEMITAMSVNNFISSTPVNQAKVPVTKGMIDHKKMSNTPGVAPTASSLLGGKQTKTSPPPDVIHRKVIAKTTPPQAPIPFDAALPLLEKHRGTPLSPAEVNSLNPPDWTDIVVIKNCPPAKPIDEGVAHPPETQPVVPTHEPVKVTPPVETPHEPPAKVKKPKQVKPKQVKPKQETPPTPKVKKRKPQYPKYYPGPKQYHYPQYHYPQYHYPQYHYPQYHYPQYHYPQYHYPQQQYTPPSSGGGGSGGGGGGHGC